MSAQRDRSPFGAHGGDEPLAEPARSLEEEIVVGPPAWRDEAFIVTLPLRRVNGSKSSIGSQLKRAVDVSPPDGPSSSPVATVVDGAWRERTGSPEVLKGAPDVGASTASAPALSAPSGARPDGVLLRLLVVALALTLLVALAGLDYLHSHPARFVALRDVVGAPAARARTASRSSSRTGHAPRTSPGTMTLVSVSTSTSTYRLSARSYAVEVTIAAPCWTVVQSPPKGPDVFAATILPSASPKRIEVQGSSSVEVAARTVSLRVLSEHRVLGTITAPVLGHHYVFLAATG